MIGKKLLARTALSTALLGSVAFGALTSVHRSDDPGLLSPLANPTVAPATPAADPTAAPVTTATPDEPVLAPQVGNTNKGCYGPVRDAGGR